MYNQSIRVKINSVIFLILSVIFEYFICFKPNLIVGIGDFKINIIFFALCILLFVNIKKIFNNSFKYIISFLIELILIILAYSTNSSGFGSIATVLAFVLTLIITPVMTINKKVFKLTFIFTLFFWIYSLYTNYYVTLSINPNEAASIPFYFSTLLISYLNTLYHNKRNNFILSSLVVISTLVNVIKYDCRNVLIMLIILLFSILLNLFKKEYKIKSFVIWFVMTIMSLIIMYAYVLLYKYNIMIDVSSVYDSGKSFFSGRQYIWIRMIEIIKKNWIFGIGSKSIYFPGSTHNYMLNVLVLFGVPHFTFFIINIYSYAKSICEYKINNINFMCLISIIVLFLTEYFESSFIGGNKFSILLFLSIIYFNSSSKGRYDYD